MRLSRISAGWGRLAAALLVLMLVVPSVVVAGGRAAAQEEKVLRIHHLVYPDDFDPQKSSFTNEIDVLALVYEGLVTLDADLNAAPGAAESWAFNEAGDVLTFTLREGLTYSDGSPLTAENFRYAIQRTCDPNTAGEYPSILFDVKGCAEFADLYNEEAATPVSIDDADAYEAARAALGVVAIDDRTLEVTLNGPAPFWPYVAYTWVVYPVKQEIVEADPDGWWLEAANHIGNGPFKLTQIEEDQLMRFEANESYWGGRPAVDAIEYVYQAESGVALEAFRSGDLDIMQVDPSQIPAVRDDPVLGPQMIQYPGANTQNLQFNLTAEPFTDLNVRKAFSMAFDRQTYCEQIRNGDCLPTTIWIPEGVAGSVESDAYGFDVAAAQAALAESSYGGPEGLPEISYFFNSDDPANTARAEFVAGMYRDNLGVELTLEPTEGKALVALRKDPSTWPQMTFAGWFGDYPDPQNWLSIYWTCKGFAVDFSYCNPALDEILTRADRELDQAARVPLYEEAHRLVIEDVPGPFLYHLANTFLVNPAVTGYEGKPVDAEWPGQYTSLLTIDINR